jgi:hypothetical protein
MNHAKQILFLPVFFALSLMSAVFAFGGGSPSVSTFPPPFDFKSARSAVRADGSCNSVGNSGGRNITWEAAAETNQLSQKIEVSGTNYLLSNRVNDLYNFSQPRKDFVSAQVSQSRSCAMGTYVSGRTSAVHRAWSITDQYNNNYFVTRNTSATESNL